MQLGICRCIRVLHRHARAKFDVLADGLTKSFVLRHPSFIECRHVEFDEARPLLFLNMQPAMHRYQMGETELPAEPVRPAK